MCVCCVCKSVGFNSSRPHRLQPTRLLCPWDSPGENIGLGCQSLLRGIFPTQGSNPGLPHAGRFFSVSATSETQSCRTPCNPMDYTVEFSWPEQWSGLPFPFSRGSSQTRSPAFQADSFPSEPTSASHSVMSNSATPWTIVHRILHARIRKWAAIPLSGGSSQPRDGTQVSCISGRFFTS